ncbi:forkhead box protein [Steccherinum ochraceum]|uniref:Forkhead box protein n=1 Tax=Steccherinum ochraceum TaxID=92696 RepID=A0A4V2MVW8_9APHY|nr:forkhead box protein [Steccherinum ochraceum]
MASLNALLNPQAAHHPDHRVQQPPTPLPHRSPYSPYSPADHTAHPRPHSLHIDHHLQSDSLSGGSLSPDAELDPHDRATSSEPTYYQNDLIPRAHPKHDNCPDTLDCLPNTDGRPQHTLPVILRCAILGSPKQRLTIREIYAAMEKKYSYYTTAGPAWKARGGPDPSFSPSLLRVRCPARRPQQSVRHHLSLNRLFERQPRPATEPGFGSYWTVNLLAPPGTKRPRKRGGRKKAADGEPLPSVPPRKPEHPQRVKDRLKELQQAASTRGEIEPSHVSAAATGTLRPVDAHSFSTSAMRGSRAYEDVDEDDSTLDDGQAGTEDEYESEDELPYQYEHPHHPPPPPSPPRYREHPGYREPPEHRSHSSHSAHSSQSHSSYATHPDTSDPMQSRMAYPAQFHPSRYQPYPRPTLHGAFSAPGPNAPPPSSYNGHVPPSMPDNSTEARLERMQQEIDALKRQSSEALQSSVRMSDQLAEAQAEATRSRSSLRVVESRLEDEIRRRVDAEKAADEELRIRRNVEDKLRTFQGPQPSSHAPSPRSYPGPLKPMPRSSHPLSPS